MTEQRISGGLAGMSVSAALEMQYGLKHGGKAGVNWGMWAYRKGELLWEAAWHNILMNEGIDYALQCALSVDSVTAEANWYVGLIKVTSPTIANADTLASHAGWTEAAPTTDYTGNRQAWTGAAATGTTTVTTSNSASKASFPILTTFVASGAFLASVSTGTAGILYAAGEYTGGDRSVQNGDTLEVQADFTLTDDV